MAFKCWTDKGWLVDIIVLKPFEIKSIVVITIKRKEISCRNQRKQNVESFVEGIYGWMPPETNNDFA